MDSNSNTDHGAGGLIATLLFYFMSKLTLSDAAMYATIAAGASTAFYNVSKWYTERKKTKKLKR